MKTLQTRMHPGVMPADTKIRARYQKGPHLMAGTFDGACGPISLWCALIVLGLATRAQVLCQKYLFTDGAFEETWRRSLELWFVGADEDEYAVLLDSASQYVDRRVCKGSMRKQIEFSIDSLRRNEVVLLGLSRPQGREGHWVTAIGIEELVADGASQVIAILCLDSSEPAPALLRYNARLELCVPQKGSTYVRFHGISGDARSWTIDSAIALSRRRRYAPSSSSLRSER